MVDGRGKQGGGDLGAELNRADPAREDELDVPGADLLVELHRGEQLPPLRGVEFHLGGQADALEEAFDARDFARG
jgi:hypothetical protein